MHTGDGPPDPYALEALSTTAVPMTADFVYVRLHGANDEHTYEYSKAQLEEIATQLHAWRSEGKAVYTMMLNDLRPTAAGSWAAMPRNAKQLIASVYSLAGTAPPPAPKKPRVTMNSFFGPKTS